MVVAMNNSLSINNPTGLSIFIDWDSQPLSKNSVGLTAGSITIKIVDTVIWGKTAPDGSTVGMRWYLVELLEFIANAWIYLCEDESLPPSPQKCKYINLQDVLTKSRAKWAEEYDEAFFDFSIVHDFAEAFHGLNAPRLAFIRQGNLMIAASEDNQWEIDYQSTINSLREMGDYIFSRISHLTDKRTTLLKSRWRDALDFNKSKRIDQRSFEIATGIYEKFIYDDISKLLTSANDDIYQIKVAARMLRTCPELLSSSFISSIFSHLKKGTANIPNLSFADNNSLNSTNQGYELAAALRDKLKISNEDKINPENILNSWGVNIVYDTFPTENIDAIAVWCVEHIPSIIVNANSFRVRRSGGKVSTLAHEICHLLVDSRAGLPAMDVLGGNVSVAIERRADAFAADFLLPRFFVASMIDSYNILDTDSELKYKKLEDIIRILTIKFEVSHELASWQIINTHHGAIDSFARRYLMKYAKSQRSLYN